VGLRIRLRIVSWASWLALIAQRGRTPMGWRGWGADYPDPSNFFEATLVTEAIRDSDSQNVSFFSNAELDRVVARAHRETDSAERMRLYERAEEIVRDEAPWIPLYTHRSIHLWQPRVRGYQPHPFEPLRVRDVWLADGDRP
jgi:ABC-type transport system substrate-binding protein